MYIKEVVDIFTKEKCAFLFLNNGIILTFIICF